MFGPLSDRGGKSEGGGVDGGIDGRVEHKDGLS